jgi:hypothetical protein
MAVQQTQKNQQDKETMRLTVSLRNMGDISWCEPANAAAMETFWALKHWQGHWALAWAGGFEKS